MNNQTYFDDILSCNDMLGDEDTFSLDSLSKLLEDPQPDITPAVSTATTPLTNYPSPHPDDSTTNAMATWMIANQVAYHPDDSTTNAMATGMIANQLAYHPDDSTTNAMATWMIANQYVAYHQPPDLMAVTPVMTNYPVMHFPGQAAPVAGIANQSSDALTTPRVMPPNHKARQPVFITVQQPVQSSALQQPASSSPRAPKQTSENQKIDSTVGTKSKRKRKRQSKSKSKVPPPTEVREDSLSSIETKRTKDYKLPDEKEFQIQLYYQSDEVKDAEITSRDGCMVYHKKAALPQEANLDIDTSTQFPDLEQSLPILKRERTKQQRKATQQLLDALEKGIRIYCDSKENVYAQRFCDARVFCYSTDQENSKWNTRKLERGKVVQVFDSIAFQEKLVAAHCRKEGPKLSLPIPAILLTVGQNWGEGDPIDNCLVYLKVTPMRLKATMQWLNQNSRNDTIDCNYTALQISLSSMSLT